MGLSNTPRARVAIGAIAQVEWVGCANCTPYSMLPQVFKVVGRRRPSGGGGARAAGVAPAQREQRRRAVTAGRGSRAQLLWCVVWGVDPFAKPFHCHCTRVSVCW